MKKLGIVVTALAVLALPAGAAAKPAKAEKRNAAKECRAERDAMGVDNFRTEYRNFGQCVKQTVREERAERKQARREAKATCKAEGKKGRALGQCVRSEAKANKAEADAEDAEELNASQTCRAEQEEMGEEEFAEKYGTNRNKRNAFGKCVSGLAQEQGDDDETEDEDEDEDEDENEDENGELDEDTGTTE